MTLPRGWNIWQIAELRRRWLAGETASIIGKAIGKTKDAVIGMAHRRGLPARPNPIQALQPPKPIFTLPLGPRSACQWIDGEPSADDSCKCGKIPLPGGVYCGFHRDKSVIGISRRRRVIPNYFLPPA